MPAILSPNVRVSFVGIPFFFLLSFFLSLFFFFRRWYRSRYSRNKPRPSFPSLPFTRLPSLLCNGRGDSWIVGHVPVSHSGTFFSKTGVFQKRHSSSSSSSSHCSARGSFTKLRLCSVTLSAAQTCPPGESTASSLNFIKKKKNGTKKKKKRKRGGKREEERQKWK